MFLKMTSTLSTVFALNVGTLLTGAPVFSQAPGTGAAVSTVRQPCVPDLKLTPGKVTPGWTLDMTEANGSTQQHGHVCKAVRREVWARYG